MQGYACQGACVNPQSLGPSLSGVCVQTLPVFEMLDIFKDYGGGRLPSKVKSHPFTRTRTRRDPVARPQMIQPGDNGTPSCRPHKNCTHAHTHAKHKYLPMFTPSQLQHKTLEEFTKNSKQKVRFLDCN